MRKLQALLLAALITVGFGTIYVVAQQYDRSAANDAPIALAQSVASSLSAGASPASLVNSYLDVATTYEPFFVIYDQQLQPIAGTGYLGAELAQPDRGVFMHAGAGKYHTVTWQPESGVRIASVEAKTGNFYVLAGQSLKLTEKRADMTLALALFGWVVSMGCLAAAYVALRPRPRLAKRKR
jgi:hypothetical protein